MQTSNLKSVATDGRCLSAPHLVSTFLSLIWIHFLCIDVMRKAISQQSHWQTFPNPNVGSGYVHARGHRDQTLGIFAWGRVKKRRFSWSDFSFVFVRFQGFGVSGSTAEENNYKANICLVGLFLFFLLYGILLDYNDLSNIY